MENLKKVLSDIRNILLFINDKKTYLTQIEKDIILQEIRKAYIEIVSIDINSNLDKPEDGFIKEEKNENKFYQKEQEQGKDSNIFEPLAEAKLPLHFNKIETEDPKLEETKEEQSHYFENEVLIKNTADNKSDKIMAGNDITTNSQKSLNDLLMENKTDNSVYNQLQQQQVSDLTKLISINDKFLFIRELFNNKGEEFSNAIKLLNDSYSLQHAFDILDRLKREFYWDSSSNAYLKLCDIIRKKFQLNR